jgi:lambda repressor-like predicted transcriptional regulator
MKDEVKHTGTPRHSGRYPWGSGDDGYQRTPGFLGDVSYLRKKGMSDVQISRSLGLESTTELRAKIAIEGNKRDAARAAMAYRLKEKGYSDAAISKRMGISDHTVASLLDSSIKRKREVTEEIANVLKKEVEGSKYGVDVGVGVEVTLGTSGTKKDIAVAMLKEQGYKIYTFDQEQQGAPGKFTHMKVLAPPGMTKIEILRNRDQIRTIGSHSDDGGETFEPIRPPVNLDSKRISVNYQSDKDGAIELRRNVDDISLGNKKYAQVRIAVDGTHYMKGMAIYSDNIPNGKDIIYNTNKSIKDADKVFKPLETKDPEYPFGAVIREKFYIDKDGNKKQSVLNVVGAKEGAGEEGAWDEWSKNLSSQVLSKQTPALAKKQLGLAYSLKKEEYDEIMSLTNPAVKQALLEPFADGCDSAAVHLKAAALPRQSSKVIIPITSLKPNEVYAPGYLPGDHLALVRHPHGGIFEIPEVIVNNKNPEGKRILGNSTDVIGMHPKVAARLSGADFDGDTVIAIPNRAGHIKTSPSIKSLTDFDHKAAYPYFEGMKVMDKHTKAIKMGDISNLITDMTIKAASQDEIARAVRHSMVVIDAEKHRLNYKQSYIDNNIAQLKKKYQGGVTAGASTLISRAGSEVRVPERILLRTRKGEETTGDKVYKETDRRYFKTKFVIDPTTGKKVYLQGEGKFLPKQTKITKMEKEKDAFALSSGTEIEKVYARHANALKDLARQARISLVHTENMKYSPSARKIYDREVESLKSKLRIAYRNKPLERHAQLVASRIVRNKRKANPNMDEDDFKRIKGQALVNARIRGHARKEKIDITDREWEAIQAGAVSHNVLKNILRNAELKSIKQRAMPRLSTPLSTARTSRARSMLIAGHTYAEIADALGVSVSIIEEAVG